MSDKEFKVKKLKCDISDIHKCTGEMEDKWLQALLLRAGVPGIMLKRKLENRTGNSQWRNYLFDKFHLDVFHNKGTSTTNVIKYMDGDKDGHTEVIAEWSKPEVVRINKKGQRPYCELGLKYWQLI